MRVFRNIIQPETEVDPDTFLDFYSTNQFLHFLGHFLIHPSGVKFYLNILYDVLVGILQTYVMAACVYSMVCVNYDANLWLQTFFECGITLCSIGEKFLAYTSSDDTAEAAKMVRTGIFHYDKEIEDRFLHIRKKSIRKTYYLAVFVCSGLCAACFMTILTPGLVALTVDPEIFSNMTKSSPINPFTPVHMYFPFDTTTRSGYVSAYMIGAASIFNTYCTFVVHLKVYITTSYQMALDLRYMIFALENMRERALIKMKHKVDGVTAEEIYGSQEFKDSMNMCLRENIIHHRNLIRFHKLYMHYVGGANDVCVLLYCGLMAAAILVLVEEGRPEMTMLCDIFGFFPMCWVGQHLKNASEDMFAVLFYTPWPDCNAKFKRSLLIIMANSLKPFRIRTTRFGVYLDMETHTDMLMLGYKMVNVLR